MVATLVATSILAFPPVSSATTTLGPPDAATASPVTVGMIIDGYDGGVGSGNKVEQGAQIAARYQNQYGDGLDGHKIELRFCANDQSATGGLLCATDMVQHKVVAVIESSSGQGPTEVPTLVQAGIPYIAMTGGSAAELTTPGAFALLGGVPAILGAVAQQAKQKGYAKVTLIVENEPTVVQGTQALGNIVFKAAGVGFDLLAADPHATDLKPELQQAVAGGASAVGVGGDAGFCSAFLRSYAALHLHLPRYVIATCLGPSNVNSRTLDKVLRGSLLAGAVTSNAKDDALYAAIVHKYARLVNPNPNVSSEDFAGLLPVLSLAAIMKDAPPSQPATAAGILARTETAKNVAIPLFGGGTFTCNGTAIALLMSICSSTSAIGTLGSGYLVTHIQTYDPSALF
jgi:branched-chain amino acid transport system substrate-binding protein